MKVAILLTGDASNYTNTRYGTYADLFQELLKDGDYDWQVYDPRISEFPELDDELGAILITGSAATAHEDHAWIGRLNQFLRGAFNRDKRLLGICFGHQAIANALGGRSEVNSSGWELGLVPLELRPPLASSPHLPRMVWNPSILQVHRDHVVELPPGASCLASSPSTPNQIFSIGDRVLAIQGHPEFFNDVVEDLAVSRGEQGVIDEKVVQEALDSLKDQPEREFWKRLMQSFLDGHGL